MIEKLSFWIKVFGVALFAFCLGLLIWSFMRPPVVRGPMPPEPAPMTSSSR